MEASGCVAPNRVVAITGTQVQSLLWKLRVILPCLPPLPLEELKDDEQEGGISLNRKKEQQQGKHSLQEASIIGHLKEMGALGPQTSMAVEMGAGTGRLSERLQCVTNGRLDHVLIDRKIFKPLAVRDRHMRARTKEHNLSRQQPERAIQRVIQDIETVDLSAYSAPFCCMSKHLCGPACDFALTGLGKAAAWPPCCFATCCHYLCSWESFSGRSFWLALGLDEEDFAVAVATSQWASMRKLPKAGSYLDDCKQSDAADCEKPSAKASSDWLPDLHEIADGAATKLSEAGDPPPFVACDEFERAFSRQEKITLGQNAKVLLDYARAAHLQQNLRYRRVRLVLYTTVSIEDRLLLASA